MTTALYIAGSIFALFLVAYLLFARWVRLRTQINFRYHIPYIYIPFWGPWRLWPDGRSMTLKLPLVGVLVWVHRKDSLACVSRLQFELLFVHEGVHYRRLEEEGYPALWRYVSSRRYRFRFELPAFAAVVGECERLQRDSFYIPGRQYPVTALFYYALRLSTQYRLGPDFSFDYCFQEIRKVVIDARVNGAQEARADG